MVNENEYESAAGVRDDGQLGDGNWGAEDSRNNLPSLDRKVDEATPLLANGGSSGINSAVDGHTIEVEWEGYADFEGLSWWRRPSVSWTFSYPNSDLTATGLLAPTSILPVRPCCRRNHRSKAQPCPITRMP